MSRTISKTELVQLYDEMAQIWPSIQLDEAAPQALDTLQTIYAGFDYGELRRAFLAYSGRERIMPKPADLIKEARAARADRNMRGAADRQYAYDPNGERTWKCPYCRDGGYMAIYLPDDTYSSLMAPCVHTRPKAAGQLKERRKFRFKLPKHDIDEVLAWNPQIMAFQPVGTFVPEWSGGPRYGAEELTKLAADELSLPF